MDQENSVIIKKSKSTSIKQQVKRFYATGRRKEASARVWVSHGSGSIKVNGKEIEKYFARSILRMMINQPFAVTNSAGQFDVVCTVSGSGLSGQAGAIRHGVSRALLEVNPEFRTLLKPVGLLTRDSRTVESKKYGCRKARKKPQFSKR